MSCFDQVKWQPISQLPLIGSMIDGALNDTRDHLQTLTEARGRPHVLDDATVDRVERVHQEQLAFVDIYAEQLRRWRGNARPPPNSGSWTGWKRRTAPCDRPRGLSSTWLLSCAWAPSTASRSSATWNSVYGRSSAGDRLGANSTLNIACNTLAYIFARMGLPTHPGRPSRSVAFGGW